MQGFLAEYRWTRLEKCGMYKIIGIGASCFSGNAAIFGSTRVAICIYSLNLILLLQVDTNVGRIAVRLGWVDLKDVPEGLQFHMLEQLMLLLFILTLTKFITTCTTSKLEPVVDIQ